jgi:hypothetical protein
MPEFQLKTSPNSPCARAMQVMIATIGKRDLQFVIRREGKIISVPIGKVSTKTELIDGLDLFAGVCDMEETTEVQLEEIEGLCLPMLLKAMRFAAKQGVKVLDRLILLPTRRDSWNIKLDAMLNSLTDEGERNRISQLIAKSMIRKYASEDFTFASAKHIADLIRSYSTELPLEIVQVNILGLGDYGFVDQIFTKGENLTATDLERADINRSDFFDFEITEALKPFLAELECSDIYISAYSGGMPTSQKSLIKVLQSLLVYPRLTPIHESEHGGGLLQQDPQDEFLAMFRSMNQCAVEMDWTTVRQFFEEINTIKPGYFSDTQTSSMNLMLDNIMNNQKEQKNWFSNIFVLTLKALYRHDYNNLHIWIKSLIETSFLELLKLPENQEKGYRFEQEYTQEIITGSKVELRFYKNALVFPDDSCCDASFNAVRDRFGKNVLHYLDEYHELFYKSKKTTRSGAYTDQRIYPEKVKIKRLRERRNELVHRGLPVQLDKNLINSLFGLLGIKQSHYHKVILDLKNHDWESVQNFERETLISSEFFKLMKSIAGITDAGWLPLERVCMKEYLGIVHGTPPPASP